MQRLPSRILLWATLLICCGSVAAAAAVPTVEEMAAEWQEAAKVRSLPALNNSWGSAQTLRDVLAVGKLSFPPETMGGDTGGLTIDGKSPALAQTRWLPFAVQRRAADGDLAIETDVRMPYEERGLLFQVRITNRGSTARKFDLGVGLHATTSSREKWAWSVPHPKEPGRYSAVIAPDRSEVILHDAKQEFANAYGFSQPPDALSAETDGAAGVWHLDLAPGASATIDYVLVFSSTDAAAKAQALAWASRFNQQFASVHDQWQDHWASMFVPGNPFFSGHLPVLETDDRDMRRLYYMGIMSLLCVLRTHFPIAPRVYVSNTPESNCTMMYFWDTRESATILSLLDPVMVKAYLRDWLSKGIEKGYAEEFQTGALQGVWYSANDYSVFILLNDYLDVTGDRAFLHERAGDKTVLEHLDAISTHWKSLVRPGRTLADYGGAANLLECVPTYIHEVPSFNAANVWMMRRTADIEAAEGRPDRAQELRADADRLWTAVLALYEPGQGVWDTLHRDGSRVPVRHVFDYATIGITLGRDLPPAMRKAMTAFVQRELITDHWMRALSLSDSAAAQSDRPDHGPMGAFCAWPPETMAAMCQMGEYAPALDFLHRCALTTYEGPFSQSRELMDKTPAAEVRIAERGGHNLPSQTFNASNGGSFAETIVRGFFGFQPDFLHPERPGDPAPRGFSGRLIGVTQGNRALDITSGPSGLANAARQETKVFALWCGPGKWTTALTVNAATIDDVEPYLFIGPSDHLSRPSGNVIIAGTELRGNASGIALALSDATRATLQLKTNHGVARIPLADLPDDGFKVVPLEGDGYAAIFGRGEPGFGPAKSAPAPLFRSPLPTDSVVLPAGWWSAKPGVQLTFGSTIPVSVTVRRVSRGDGTLYLEVFDPSGPLHGHVDVACGGRSLGHRDLLGSLWLAAPPHLAETQLTLTAPGGSRDLAVPATLVETRGNRIFVNGEPFLIKGTLPGEITDADAKLMRSLGINTVRGFGEGKTLTGAEQHGFMVLASIQGGGLGKLSDYHGDAGAKKLAADLPAFLKREAAHGAMAAASPNTLIIQLDNERTAIGANPWEGKNGGSGADPWSEYLKGGQSEFYHLDQLLALDWNAVKPLAPGLPLGYANESQGFIAPGYLDVYLHNTYLYPDRYTVPQAEFSRWEGGGRRPFVNSEYGSNRYTPEAYHGAPNSPILEKLQAWGYEKTWNAFMAAGTSGGTCYRLLDRGAGQPLDQGTSNFGILTADHAPKLACFALQHLWRDFEAEGAGEGKLALEYKRDYWARDCRLTVTSGGHATTLNVADFAPHAARPIAVPALTGAFHWQIEYTTHGGLPMLAEGAFPAAVERDDFRDALRPRPNAAFLGRLLDAEVEATLPAPLPQSLAGLERPDHIVPVAFGEPDGTVYVTAFARLNIDGQPSLIADIDTRFIGIPVRVDERTGEPTGEPVRWAQGPHGVRLLGVPVIKIPGPIGRRSNQPLALAVYRLTEAPPGRKT